MPLKPREAALRLGVSYPTLKKWIYSGKLRTMITPGGHHRIAEVELEKFLPREEADAGSRRRLRGVSGRNQLLGRVVEVKTNGFLTQVKLSISGQIISSIVTADAVAEMGLKKGDLAIALIKSTEVMLACP